MASIEEPRQYEVIIVGAGIMGSSTAYFLSKVYGYKVLLLEQFDSHHRKGSSHGESRITRLTYDEAHYTKLMFDAYKNWELIEKESKTKLYTKTGGIFFGTKNNPNLKNVTQNMEIFNIEHECLSSAETRQRFPTLKLPENYVSVYQPEAGLLNASKAVVTLQYLARANGCEFLDNTGVSSIVPGEMIKVETTTGKTFVTKKCILTAGPWMKKLVKSSLKIELPLTPIETAVAYWRIANEDAYSSKRFPIFIHYEEPFAYGGPAHEYTNLIKCGGYANKDVPCDPDIGRTFDPEKNQALGDKLRKFVGDFFEGVNAEVPAHKESCMFTYSPDEGFIIDSLVPNIFIGCGFSGHGFKLGPVVGQMLTNLVVNDKPLYPEFQHHFSLDRFNNK